jgi:hypothetical protein
VHLVDLRVKPPEDQEVAVGLQPPRDRGERFGLKAGAIFVRDKEARGDVVRPVLPELVDALGSRLAAVRGLLQLVEEGTAGLGAAGHRRTSAGRASAWRFPCPPQLLVRHRNILSSELSCLREAQGETPGGDE